MICKRAAAAFDPSTSNMTAVCDDEYNVLYFGSGGLLFSICQFAGCFCLYFGALIVGETDWATRVRYWLRTRFVCFTGANLLLSKIRVETVVLW